MVKSRKKFDREFKLMAVELIETHKTVAEVAKELGVHKNLLYQWRNKFLKKGQHSFSGNGNKTFTPEEAEIERLKKELREAENVLYNELDNAVVSMCRERYKMNS